MTDPLDDFAMLDDYVRDHHPIAEKIDRALLSSQAEEEERGYLGASIAGQECERALWYDYTHATAKSFPPSILRRFETGHLMEERCIRWLKAAGYNVIATDPHGQQYRCEHLDGAISGHVDGFIWYEGRWHLLEIKAMVQGKYERDAAGNPTRNKVPMKGGELTAERQKVEGRWFKTKRQGVKSAQPTHYAQMQIYMGLSGISNWPCGKLESAIYIAIGTDTDHIHVEEVPFSAEDARDALKRAQRVVKARTIPFRLHENPAAFVCRYCDHLAICHQGDAMVPSCRTCKHADPVHWTCNHLGIECPASGCNLHAPCEEEEVSF